MMKIESTKNDSIQQQFIILKVYSEKNTLGKKTHWENGLAVVF